MMDSGNEEIFTVIKLEHDKLVACIKDDTLSEYLSDAFSDGLKRVVTYIEEEIEAGNLPTPPSND
jgi:hypothetical protein